MNPSVCLHRIALIGVCWFVAAAALHAQLLPAKPDLAPFPHNIFLGDFVAGDDTLIVREHGGGLEVVRGSEIFPATLLEDGERFSFETDTVVASFDRPTILHVGALCIGQTFFHRLEWQEGTFRIVPRTPVDLLRKKAVSAKPPVERGTFLTPDLVEVAGLDSTIRYDLRYASDNNFMGAQFYSQSRALLQRPAAMALMRAHRWLAQYGYGILIHDAYRPWSVTWMFWEATPPSQRAFVANPAKGSKHNRGCAVDLTLYDRVTGQIVEMPSGYDEFSHRAYADYPGGTDIQRWHRMLLRTAMEREGFSVERVEWWHFDYRDWRRYPLLNVPFERLNR